MIITASFDDKDVVMEEKICPYHKKHPHKQYAGCTCSRSYVVVWKKSPKPDKTVTPVKV